MRKDLSPPSQREIQFTAENHGNQERAASHVSNSCISHLHARFLCHLHVERCSVDLQWLYGLVLSVLKIVEGIDECYGFGLLHFLNENHPQSTGLWCIGWCYLILYLCHSVRVHTSLSESSNEVGVGCTCESGGQMCAFILFLEVFVSCKQVAENDNPSLFHTYMVWCK